MNERFETYSPAETEAFGEKLGREAKAGQVYCLSGDLGVGKTVFTKGFAKGLEVTEYVTSPTFAIVNEYEVNENSSRYTLHSSLKKIYHFDFYRIKKIEEVYDMGYEDYFYSGNLCLIEWPELIEDLLPEEALCVTIEEQSDGSRLISC